MAVPASDISQQAVAVDTRFDHVYHCIASLQQANTHGKVSRTIDNVAQLKSLVVDVDVKAGGYATKPEALAGLRSLLDSTGLPVPSIVDSGGGLHLYWALETAIPLERWKPLAMLFRAVLQHAKFQVVDWGLLVNPVLLLRPPGTTHRKTLPGKPVSLLRLGNTTEVATLQALLDGYATAHQVVVAPVAPSRAALSTEEIEGRAIARKLGFLPPAVEKEAHPIVAGCQQIRECADSPAWRSALSVLRLCADGADWCHQISALGDSYDPVAVDKKLSAMDAAHGEGMPHTCHTFDNTHPGICHQCPHWGRIKSPITLGLPQTAASAITLDVPASPTIAAITEAASSVTVDTCAPLVPPPPAVHGTTEVLSFSDFRYQLSPAGITYFADENDSGEKKPVLITKNQMFPIGVVRDIDALGNPIYSYLWRIYPRPGTDIFSDYLIPAADLHKDRSGVNVFAQYGVLVEAKKHWEVFSMITRSLAGQIQQARAAIETRPALGWSEDLSEFVCGAETVDSTTGIRRTVPGDALRSYITAHLKDRPAGTLAGWRAAADVFAQPGQEHGALGLAISFGAPLMRFTPQAGALVHFVAETGFGKTTIQKVAAAVWGNPEESLVKAAGDHLGDTLISVFSRATLHNNIMVALDEITNMPRERVSGLVHAVSLGHEKSRMRAANGTHVFRGGSGWRTLFFSSANSSVINMLSQAKVDYAAEAARVLEFRLPPVEMNAQSYPNKLKLDAIVNNYGHAGIAYARWLVVNRDVLPTLVTDKMVELVDALGFRQEERFHISAMAAMLVGLFVAKCAGLHSIDVDHLQDWLLKKYLDIREDIKSARGGSDKPYSDMLGSLIGETLVIEGDGSLIPFAPLLRPRGAALTVRVELDAGMLFVSATRMRKWAKENGLAVTDVLRDAAASGVAQTADNVKNVALGRKVREYSGLPATRCYVFSMPPEQRANFKELILTAETTEDDA